MREVPKVAILGVTGFIGRGLPPLLAGEGWSVTGFSRTSRHTRPAIQSWQHPDQPMLAGYQAVINLAGEPIDRRWTPANRRLFHESRIGVTRRLVAAIRELPAGQRPGVLVNGSAVGIYGDRGDESLAEDAAPGSGYLADLCREWEAAALEAVALGVRVVCLRTGVVLGRDGPAFGKMVRVFKTGLGGRLGSGRQWMPWIHVDDLRAAIVHAVTTESLAGPVNGCAPQPERNRDFTRQLGRALHRPAFFPVPPFALRLAVGEFSSALLASQRCQPAALLTSGFRFAYPDLQSALADLID